MSNRKTWNLCVECCKMELIAIVIWISSCYFCLLFAVTSNLIFTTNEYRLPINFFIIWLPFEGFDFYWALNYLFQLVTAFSVATFFYVYLPTTLVLMNQCCLQVDAAIVNVAELKDVLKNGQDDRDQLHKRLKEIIDVIHHAEIWQEDVQNLLRFSFLIDFTSLSFLLCMCMYTLLINIYGSVLIFMVMNLLVTQLFIYCWMGSRFISRVEALAAEVYDIDWPSMDIKVQKNIPLILLMTQNMKFFNGIFKMVRLETFQKVRISNFLFHLQIENILKIQY